jgi:hypothetical protein
VECGARLANWLLRKRFAWSAEVALKLRERSSKIIFIPRRIEAWFMAAESLCTKSQQRPKERRPQRRVPTKASGRVAGAAQIGLRKAENKVWPLSEPKGARTKLNVAMKTTEMMSAEADPGLRRLRKLGWRESFKRKQR